MASTSDEYDEHDDVQELNHLPLPPNQSSSGRTSADRIIRRRSSKACDGCRKAKCKCERTPQAVANGDPCRNCVLLGQECTFLGPSRKRGPPKGYIDALESKLHQMEALLGTIITSEDVRARSLVFDLSQDSLANEIIQRVDETPFGTRGRKQAAANRELYGRSSSLGVSGKRRDSAGAGGGSQRGSPGEGEFRFGFSGPPHEWQDSLSNLINSRPHERLQANGGASGSRTNDAASSSTGPSSYIANGTGSPHSDFSSAFNVEETKPIIQSNYAFDPINPYQRRRIETPHSPPLNLISARGLGNPVLVSSGSSSSLQQLGPTRTRSSKSLAADFSGPHSHTPPNMRYRGSPYHDDGSESDGSDIADTVGQLSINDMQQVRYHGKASGLHLLMPAMEDGDAAAADGAKDLSRPPSRGSRVNKGIWKFPPAGVWPPAPPKSTDAYANPYAAFRRTGSDDQIDALGATHLPDRSKQEHLVGLFFNYVHPVLPVLHRKQFFKDFAARSDSSHPGYADAVSRIPNFLLLAMFSVAARYSNDTPLPADGQMWSAGDDYFDRGRELLVTFTSLSRPEYVQAMLLMGYREIGLGTMAQAWLYIGIAIRTAQDLGLHRSIAKWQLAGAKMFSPEEKETRARIWHCCIRLDRYVSTYIGRPLTVYEHDYDTQLPEEDSDEENDLWAEYPTLAAGVEEIEDLKLSTKPQPARVISCFKQSIALSKLLGNIVRNFYAIRAPSCSIRYKERIALEQKLERWMLDLPEHFRCDNPNKPTSPNVLTLHMQYWCTVLLLNRPFIRRLERNPSSPRSSSSSEPEDASVIASKAFATCQTAAHHLTNIASAFAEAFCIRRAPAIFTYYIFSASIMHVTSLLENAVDVQASLGLQKTMGILKRLSVIWPSAGRAWDLLDGVKIDVRRAELALLTNAPERKKRMAVEADFPHLPFMNAAPGLSSSFEHLPSTGSSRPSPGGNPHTDRPFSQYSLPPIHTSHTPPTATSPSSMTPHSSYPRTSPTHNIHPFDMAPPPAASHPAPSAYHTSAPSYDQWTPRSPHHSARSHVAQSAQSHMPHASYSQPPPSSEPQYTYVPSQAHLPPLTYSSSITNTRTASHQSQSPFQDTFSPPPVPSANQNYSSAGGYWSGYPSSDPFGDPALLSSFAPGGPGGPGAYENTGAHAVMQAVTQESHPSNLPSGYAAINAYFSDTGTSGVYFGSGSRPPH